MNILVIEDDVRIADLVQLALREDGHQVTVSGNGREGAELLLTGEFHAALLDIYLPELNGFEVLRRVRSSACTTPILVLTAVDAVPKIVQAFDLGADDYLVKPFILEILLARISAIARRIGIPQPRLVNPSSLSLDRSRRRAIRNGREVALTRKQYDLLEILIRHKGVITTRERLIEAGWGLDAEVRENTLEVYIHGLRSKLEVLYEKDQVVLRTVHGAGYMLVLDVLDVTDASDVTDALGIPDASGLGDALDMNPLDVSK